ncbi:carboxypeptidase-like regulatory domain-containing protein [Flavobacterium sp. MC2016-06]|uniref:carboxypeptidase-like regulatory domain-containing protein n=1 Tax=Flavobacterium sp. MC2016-06 TaxID=2676308 RepID=UPI0012BAAB46|nr:carboxypeptidase-like regulatory domain-containing protein [Flavobacterium sp. MC2016-06]MBU3861856.1 carboxypeptidase-like regulatory domain-containing protein [Flavobacterium sp. MC2016-06]
MTHFKLKKNQIIILFLFVSQIAVSQNKVLFVIDKTTNFPIENAVVFSSDSNQGTFTNSEGKASINVKSGTVKISKLGFDDSVVEVEKAIKLDTLFLTPQAVQLDELVIKSFNLNKALQYVLDNFKDLYVHTPFEKECNFKETVVVDDQLKRLILTKVNWWDKTYERKKNNTLKLRLGAIDYNKNIPLNIFTDVPRINENKSVYLTPNSLINTLYFNSYLFSFLRSSKNMTGSVEESPLDQIIVSFESEWENTEEVLSRLKGRIVFDKKTKAVLEFINTIEYKNNLKVKTVKENGKESVSETKTASWRLLFYKTEDNLFALKAFDSTIEMTITYDNKIHPCEYKNSIYVLKEMTVNKVNDDGLMDLSKPIYQNLPSQTIANVNSILLNKAENDFINSNK